MKRQFLLLFFALLLATLSSWAVDTGPVITISTPNTSTCGTVDVPVKVSNFTNVGAISLRLNYNSSVLSYQSRELNEKISSSVVNTSTAGTIKLGWNSATAINLIDNEVLFTLHFSLLPTSNGGNTDLTWGSDYREIAGVGSNPPVYSSTFVDLSTSIPAWPVNNLTRGLGYCTIQAAVNAASADDEIEVSPGTFAEAVTITKNLKLHGMAGEMANTIIMAPSTLPAASDLSNSNIVTIKGPGVEVELYGLTVKGPGPTGCGSIGHGIFVIDGAYANIHNNQILDIRDTELPVSGCQNGVAIRVGRSGLSTSGTATISNNLITGYQKGAIVVDNTGSSATISDNTITGLGTTTITAQNGIQISSGATATLQDNRISGNSFHIDGNTWDWGACGILLYQSGAVSLTGGNNILGNDQNYYAYESTGTLTLGAEVFGASSAPVTKGYHITDYSNQSIDASLCAFENITLGTASLTQLFAIEDRIWHSVDDQTKTGFVKVKAGNVYVTRTETGAHIQYGIDAAVAGDLVNVQAGDYGIETAANRSVYGNGPHQFGLYIDKNNLTVRGYKPGDVPVASASEAAVEFKTGSTSNFGPDGIFVQGNGVTLEGLKIGDNFVNGAISSNKTIDVIGDDFTMNKCYINTSTAEGALYFSNWNAPALPIAKYSITNNIFNNALVSINSGAGMTGDRNGRLITGNTFTGVATPYLIGFRGWNGASPTQGWIVDPVGGAVVTGNTFNNTEVVNYILARGNVGGYDNSQLNWSEMWTSNTFGNHVVTLSDESIFAVRSYTDAAGYPETRRISPKIQENVTIGQTGDVVLVSDGTFAENVVITNNISLLSVNGAASTIIDGVNAGAEQGAIELKSGRDGVTIGSIGHGFTVKGIDGPPGAEKAAIYLQGTQTHITIEDNIIEARGDAALQGEWNALNTQITINKNVITGQTFNGAVPATGDQFTVPNVARQAVAFGGGTGTTNTGNFTFTNNVISAITGITAIGNGLVTLDLIGNNTISGNTFTGQPGPTAWRPALRVRGSGTYAIKKNSFTGNFNLALERQGTTVDATENWWGHASGPYNDPQNLCGLGKAVTSNVTFRPWYTDEAMTTLSAAAAVPVVETVIPTSSTVECESSAVIPTLPVVKDYCGTVLTPTAPAMSGAMTGCEGTKIYTYTYTDALGQQLVWAYTYTIVRTTLPSEIGDHVSTTGGTVECASAATAPTILPVVKDVCGVVIPAPSPEVSSVSCEGTKTFTYRYKDCANKEFVWVYTYTIDHTTAPVVPAAGSSTVACLSNAVAPLSMEALDQQQTAFVNYKMDQNTGVGQSFTPSISGKLSKIDVNIYAFEGTPTFSVEVYQGDGKVGSPVYSTSGYTVSSTGWVSLNLPINTAPSLVAGTKYTFWITAYPYNSVQISLGANVYTGGVSWDECTTCTPSLPATSYSDYDLMFKTYMTTAPVVTDVCGNVIPTPTPVVTGTFNGCSGTKIYTYTYKDCANLSTDWAYTYTIAPPVVTMPSPQSSTVACVSAATKPTPPVVTDNCGRTMTVDEGVASEDPTCNGTKTWTFKYIDCANVEYTWVYTYTITNSGGLTAPTAGASTVAGPAQAVNPGAPANITDACGRTVTPVLIGRTPETGPECEGTVVWTYRYTACDGTTTADWTYTYTIVKSTVSGKLTYNNASQTPMSGVTLTLTPGGMTSLTGVNGDYVFQGLCPGNYTIAVTNNQKPVGGVNSTDAGGANYWSTHWGAIQHVNFLAGDVTGDKFIAADDALAIQNQWVNEVPANPLWSYWKKGETILSNDNPYEVGSSTKPWPSNISITVNGDVADFDLYALCTGDFNGSYNSNALKSTAQSIVLNSNTSLNVSAKQEFVLPVRAGHTMEVGAVSMILQVPSKMVTVLDVKVMGSNAPVSWSVKGDELRIGWNSLTPVKVNENSSLLTLKLRTTDAFTYGEYFDLALAVNPANELADGKFNTIDGALLLAAKIGNGLVGVNPDFNNSGLSLNNYPNPFKNSTTVDYTIPFDGKVILSLYNQIGQLVNTMVDSNQSTGKYTVKVDGTLLTPGVYVAKLLLNNQKEIKVCTVKLVVMK